MSTENLAINPEPFDFTEARNAFIAAFADLTAKRFPIDGRNFITPDVLGFVRFHTGETVEISTGTFGSERLYGVTFPRLADGRPDARDRSFTALADVRAYVKTGAE